MVSLCLIARNNRDADAIQEYVNAFLPMTSS